MRRWHVKRPLFFAVLVSLALATPLVQASPYPLSEIMERDMADKLAAQQVSTTTQLLEQGAGAKQRAALAKKAAVPLPQLTSWVKMCDLLRIQGVGPEMVRLLDTVKISTTRQLKSQKAAKLHPRLLKANDKAKVTENPPDIQQVQAWIQQAQKLPQVLR